MSSATFIEPSGWAEPMLKNIAAVHSQLSLMRLNGFAAMLHFISAVLGTLLCANDSTSVAVYEPLFEYSKVKGARDASFFIPTPKKLFSVKVLWPYVAVEYITAFFHVWYLTNLFVEAYPTRHLSTLFRPAYRLSVWLSNGKNAESANTLRWFEYAITASLLSAFGGLAIGLNQFPYFVHILSSGVALQMCGYLIEMLDYTIVLHQRIYSIAINLGTILNLTSVGILLYQIFASKTHTTVFYYNVVPFAIYYQTFGFVAMLRFFHYKQFQSKWFVERWYIILSLSTKVAVFWLSFATFRQLAEDNGFLPRTPGVEWTAVRFSASFIPLGLLAATAVRDAMRWPRLRTQPEFAGANVFLRERNWKMYAAKLREAREEQPLRDEPRLLERVPFVLKM